MSNSQQEVTETAHEPDDELERYARMWLSAGSGN